MNVLIHIEGVDVPLIKLIVASGVTVIVPVVVMLAQPPVKVTV